MTKRFELKEIINRIGLPEGKQIQDNLTGDRGLSIEDLINIANEQDQKIKELKRMLQLVSESTSARTENSVKEIIRNNLFGLDSVAGESANAFNDYITLKKFFKKYYNEHWDNDKFD